MNSPALRSALNMRSNVEYLHVVHDVQDARTNEIKLKQNWNKTEIKLFHAAIAHII